MKDIQTVARPYSKALFELALEHQSLNAWSDALSVLSQATMDSGMQRLLHHPEVSTSMLVDILLAVAKQALKNESQMRHLEHALAIMSVHRRLPVIPEIYRQFELLKAQHHHLCSGIVYSATSLDDAQMKHLIVGLEKKLNKSVRLTQVIQPELLGGAKIQIGDMMIDGTLRGRIHRLAQTMYAAC